MSRLFFVRHVSVEYTNDPVVDLSIDASPRGKEQAQALAEKWTEKTDHIYSSPLLRAVQTVIPLAQKVRVDIIEDNSFRELEYMGNAQEFHHAILSDRNFKFLGGESIVEATDRFHVGVHNVAKRHAGGIVIATHGTVLSQFLISQFNFPEDAFFHLSYPDVYEVRYNSEASSFTFISRRIDLLPDIIEQTLT